MSVRKLTDLLQDLEPSELNFTNAVAVTVAYAYEDEVVTNERN